MHDEKGYVQFQCDWDRTTEPVGPTLDELRTWRDQLHQLGLIGVYPDGIGYGNLSCRPNSDGSFFITGTATGHLASLGPEHLAEVTAYDIARNWVRCRGPVQASSESLSHAAVYRSEPAARAIIHVHHMDLWKHLFDRLPTTDPQCEAGTPAMANAIEDLFKAKRLRGEGLFVMGGHREGLIAFGGNLDEAGTHLLEALKRYQRGEK